MAYLVDMDGLREKLFTLEHMAYGSKEYCGKRRVGGESDIGNAGFDEYWGWAKAIISSMVIDVAIKLRMIDDYCKRNADPETLNQIHGVATDSAAIARVVSGNVDLTLRECWNKIVHAERAQLVYASPGVGDDSRYWTGELILSGTQHGKEWTIELYVANWSRANESLIDELEGEELLLHMGQDSSE